MHEIPSTPASSDGFVWSIARRVRATRVALHLQRMAVVGVVVASVLSVVSLYLAKVGVDRCAGEVCTHQRWYPLSIQLRSEHTTRSGVVDGLRTEWHPNGAVSIQGRYDLGTKIGPWVEFWPSGKPMFEGTYAAGVRVGTETWWYESGAREWEVRHASGQRHGAERWWFPSGALRREGTYRHGAKHGTFVVYNEDGAEAFRAQYEDGAALGGEPDDLE